MADVTERAEDLGYVRYKCWRCGRSFHSDGEPDCCEPQRIADDEETDEP